MTRWRPGLLLCLLLLSFSASSAELSGQVSTVYSGRDIALLTATRGRYLIRLRGIRLIDRDPAIRRAAKRRLNGLIGGRQVRVRIPGKQLSGKLSGYITWGGKEVNQELVANGLVNIDEAELDSTRLRNYRAARAGAQQRRLGIWAGGPVKPRVFIKKHR